MCCSKCTEGWLEPLLHRVREDRTVAVCPIIDIISDESFALLRSFELHHGGISWRLHFRWLAASQLLMAVIYLFFPYFLSSKVHGSFLKQPHSRYPFGE